MIDIDEAPDRLVDTREAARILGLSVNTLNKRRIYSEPSTAIPFVKLGKLVKYSTRELARHKVTNTRTSTSQRARS